MDNKGLTFIFVSFVLIVIGLALIGTVGGDVSVLTTQQTSSNVSFTLPANATTADFAPCGQKAVTYQLFNSTNGTVGFQGAEIATTEYKVTQGASAADGYVSAQITTWETNAGYYASQPVNVTCTYEPRGYIPDSGGRGVAGLILIFFAFMIAIAALPNVREWVGWK